MVNAKVEDPTTDAEASEDPTSAGAVDSALASGGTGDGAFDPLGDEWANTLTHALGTMLALAGWALIAWLMWDRPFGITVACWVYAASVFSVFFFSTLSHAVRHPSGRQLMRAWDQGTIYLMIAGTYTPFLWFYCLPAWRFPVLVAVWGLAAAGFLAKVMLRHRVNAIATPTYLMLGWLPALPMIPRIPDPMPWTCFYGMLAGGVLYTLGVVFLQLDQKVRFFHAAWHLFVIAAAATHFLTIVFCIATQS